MGFSYGKFLLFLNCLVEFLIIFIGSNRTYYRSIFISEKLSREGKVLKNDTNHNFISNCTNNGSLLDC